MLNLLFIYFFFTPKWFCTWLIRLMRIIFLRDFLFLLFILFESMFLLHPKTSSISLEIIFYAWLMGCQNWFVRKLTPYCSISKLIIIYIAEESLLYQYLVLLHTLWRNPQILSPIKEYTFGENLNLLQQANRLILKGFSEIC